MDPFKRIDEKLNSILVAVENNCNRKIDFNLLEVSLNRKFNNIPETDITYYKRNPNR